MPQVLKEEVRERILGAALEVFARRGYEGATMAAIAERAGLGAAGMYRYFASKEELFAAVVTPELAERFASVTERRVRALSHAVLGDRPHHGDTLGEEMLRFWLEHRLAVVILLDRAQGTPHAHFGERFVELLVTSTLAQIREASPGLRVSPTARAVLTRIFENTRRMLAALLETNESERALREAIEGFWSYQVPGLKGFARWLQGQR